MTGVVADLETPGADVGAGREHRNARAELRRWRDEVEAEQRSFISTLDDGLDLT
jgi:hypothetical protein